MFQTVVLNPTGEALDAMGDVFNVNELQRDFLHMVSRNVLSILDGPPGTGKTSTLLPLLIVWARDAPEGFAVVVTAGSNSALDNIMWRLVCSVRKHNLDLDLAQVVRFARGEAIKDDRVYPYTPDGFFTKGTGAPLTRRTARRSPLSSGRWSRAPASSLRPSRRCLGRWA